MLPRVASSLALEPDEEGAVCADEVVFLHRPGEGVAKGLYDPGVVGPGGVVEGEALPAVPIEHRYRGLYPIYPETATIVVGYRTHCLSTYNFVVDLKQKKL